MVPEPVVKVANPQGGMDPNPATKSPEDGLVEQLAGMEMRSDDARGGKPINQAKVPAHQHDERKLFVGGLPTHVTEAEFLQFFEQFGEVIDSVVMIDRVTKRSRGFGFVTFAKEEVAHSLLNSIPGKTGMINIQGKSCEIKASEPKSMTSPTPRYIHGSGGPRNNNHLPSNQGGYAPRPPHASPTLAAPAKVSAMTPHPPSDRYYDSRNFDQLYNGHHSGYAPNSMYSGYQYSGWENSYPYPYGQYGGDHSSYGMQGPHGYYEGYGSQYNYSQGGYAYPNGYYGGNYPGQSSSIPTTAHGTYRSDGSLESYGEAYYEGAEGSD